MNSGDVALWLLKVFGSVLAVAAVFLGPSRYKSWKNWRETKRDQDQSYRDKKWRRA